MTELKSAALELGQATIGLAHKVAARHGLEICECEIGGCSALVVLAADDRSQPICAECVEQLAECEIPFTERAGD